MEVKTLLRAEKTLTKGRGIAGSTGLGVGMAEEG